MNENRCKLHAMAKVVYFAHFDFLYSYGISVAKREGIIVLCFF
jgi:hypothetical protein